MLSNSEKINFLHKKFLSRSDNQELIKLRQASRLTGIEYESLRTAILEKNLPAVKLRDAANSPLYINVGDLASFCVYGHQNGAINTL